MPVVRRKPDAPDLGRYEPLVADLAAELTRTDGAGQPLVEELDLPRAKMFEVDVFWDRWQGVPDSVRPAIIQQAYVRSRPGDVDRLAFAAGYTTEEAVEAGVLPFTVEVSNSPGSFGAVVDLQALMRGVGGLHFTDADGWVVIPCRTRQEAERCRDAILAKAPPDAAKTAVRIHDRGRR